MHTYAGRRWWVRHWRIDSGFLGLLHLVRDVDWKQSGWSLPVTCMPHMRAGGYTDVLEPWQAPGRAGYVRKDNSWFVDTLMLPI